MSKPKNEKYVFTVTVKPGTDFQEELIVGQIKAYLASFEHILGGRFKGTTVTVKSKETPYGD